MSLTTKSKFYYGHTVTSSNRFVDFKEGLTTFAATIQIGSYSLTEFALQVASAMNDQGSNTYTVTVNRTTGVLTLNSSASFDLLGATGANVAQTALNLMGFSLSDSLGVTSVTGITRSGFSYEPQLTLQDHLASVNNKRALSAVVTKAASGNSVTVQSFGIERFIKLNIKYVTELYQPSGQKLDNDSLALTNLRNFLDYCITKSPLEYMANKSNPSIYEIVLLESSSGSQDGTGYELKEYYDKSLPNYFETGLLTFKVVEE